MYGKIAGLTGLCSAFIAVIAGVLYTQYPVWVWIGGISCIILALDVFTFLGYILVTM